MNSSWLSRRDFLVRSALATSALAFSGVAFAEEKWSPKIVIFSKVYQELKLNFEDAADLTAESGLDGIDCPVRPKGEIEPPQAEEDMVRYADALKKRKVMMGLITTGITSVASPNAEQILRTAKKLGIRYYRLGSPTHRNDKPGKPVSEIRAELKELAALNKQLGLTALFQNHSPSGKSLYSGGDLNEMYEIVKDFDPNQVGVAFDLSHALIVHGDDWTRQFERLKPHIKAAYIKDVKLPRQMVTFGEGEFSKTDYFKRLRALKLDSPISLHIEYDWNGKEPKTRALLLKMIRHNLGVLKQWIANA